MMLVIGLGIGCAGHTATRGRPRAAPDTPRPARGASLHDTKLVHQRGHRTPRPETVPGLFSHQSSQGRAPSQRRRGMPGAPMRAVTRHAREHATTLAAPSWALGSSTSGTCCKSAALPRNSYQTTFPIVPTMRARGPCGGHRGSNPTSGTAFACTEMRRISLQASPHPSTAAAGFFVLSACPHTTRFPIASRLAPRRIRRRFAPSPSWAGLGWPRPVRAAWCDSGMFGPVGTRNRRSRTRIPWFKEVLRLTPLIPARKGVARWPSRTRSSPPSSP